MARRKEAPVASVYITESGYGGMVPSQDGRFALSAMDGLIKAHDTRLLKGQKPWWIVAPEEPVVYDVPASDLHEKNIPSIALSPDDKTFATASEDGFIRLFTAVVSPEAEESTEVDKQANPSPDAVSPEKTESALSPKGKPQQDELKVDAELIQACARFGGPARSVAFSPTGSWLAAAGDEPGVLKLIMVCQPSTVQILRRDPQCPGFQPIIHMDYDPQSDFIATVAPNGVCGVWNVDSGDFTALEMNDRKALCVSWSPDGSKLLVGTHTGSVLVNRTTWAFDKVLEELGGGDDEELVACPEDLNITAVAWSNNGKYVLTARKDVTLWDVENLRVLSSWMSDGVIHSLRWHPKINAFMLLDNIGQYAIVGDVVPDHLPLPYGNSSRVKLPNIPSDSGHVGTDGGSSSDGDSSDTVSGSDDEDISVRRSRAKLKLSAKRAAREARKSGNTSRLERENERDDDYRAEISFNADELDADDEDDAVELRRQREEEEELVALEEAEARESRRRRKQKRRQEREAAKSGSAAVSAIPKPQPSFVSSSTPLSVVGVQSDDGLPPTKIRLLCWNLVATVVSFSEESHNVVEVEFADSNRRVIGIKDHFGFHLGSVSETGLLLACPKTEEHSSIVSFRPFRSWSGNSEWTQHLSVDESALTLALGARFAAVATNQNVVRIFSLSGLQVDTFGMPGRVVTMAAVGDRLAVVYAPSEYSPEVRFELLKVANSGEVAKVLANDQLVLSPGSKLEWFGFTTDTTDLVAYDSAGSLWLQPCHRGGGRWLPMMREAGKLADCQWFWVASVSAESVIGAQCFSNERFPPAKPRPALRTIPLMAPVVEPVSKNGASTLEERLFRSRLRLGRVSAAKAAAEEVYNSDDDEMDEAEDTVNTVAREVDKCLLGLMEVAARGEQGLRAFDLATRMSSSVGLKYAVSLANHYKRGPLASRIEQLAMRQIAAEEEEKLEKLESKRLLRLQALGTQRASPVTPAPAVNSGKGNDTGSEMDPSQEPDEEPVRIVDDDKSDLEGNDDADVDALVTKKPAGTSTKRASKKPTPKAVPARPVAPLKQADKRKPVRAAGEKPPNRFAKRVKR